MAREIEYEIPEGIKYYSIPSDDQPESILPLKEGVNLISSIFNPSSEDVTEKPPVLLVHCQMGFFFFFFF
jgi:hypothetical protein